MANTFDNIGELYDLMVPWESRLAREEPFFKRVIGTGPPSKRILDAACGTGHHALMFHRLGHSIIGLDSSITSISVAERLAEEYGSNVFFVNTDLLNPGKLFDKQYFDVVTVLGNSIAQFVTYDDLKRVFNWIQSVLKPGGLFVFQILNFLASSIIAERFPPFRSAKRNEDEILFQKIFDFESNKVTLNLLILIKEKDKWSRILESTILRPWNRVQLERSLVAAGFTNIDFYGDYSFSEFSQSSSKDLIVVARTSVD